MGMVKSLISGLGWILVMLFASALAYDIRMYAIRGYGYVIHEFDPWFNYRATEYLDQHGWKAFFHWFDYESWYPLGRPVGTTIYPGMQITSVCIKWTSTPSSPGPAARCIFRSTTCAAWCPRGSA